MKRLPLLLIVGGLLVAAPFVFGAIDPLDPVDPVAFLFDRTEDNSPIARYLWLWIKWICYTLGGVAGAAGLIFGIFGFWVGRGPIIKQGIVSAIAGFAFVLVIPFVRIVFGEWVTFAEEDPFLPEGSGTALLLFVRLGLACCMPLFPTWGG